jgi:hypothetical protein
VDADVKQALAATGSDNAIIETDALTKIYRDRPSPRWTASV